MTVGCTAATVIPPKGVDAFVGSYMGTLTGRRTVVLAVDENMDFVYREDSFRRGRVAQVVREGTLKWRGRRLAKAGQVKLEWLTPHNIKVWSPYGSTIGHGNNDAFVDGRSGVNMSAAAGHVFYLNRTE